MRVYPALDLMGGRCVRLKQGRFDDRKTYDQDPARQLALFAAAGAEGVHLVDLDGARDPKKRQLPLLRELIGSTPLKVQVGGGIRAPEQALELLRLGADRVVLGSLLVRDPELGRRMLAELGPQRVTAAFDVRMEGCAPRVALDGWNSEGPEVSGIIRDYLPYGLKRVLCTDIAKDGMLAGPNLALYEKLTKAFPGLELQASGGIGSLADLDSLRKVPVHSAVVGKALYEGKIGLREALAC